MRESDTEFSQITQRTLDIKSLRSPIPGKGIRYLAIFAWEDAN